MADQASSIQSSYNYNVEEHPSPNDLNIKRKKKSIRNDFMGNVYNDIVDKMKSDLAAKALQSLTADHEITSDKPLPLFENKDEQKAAL